MGEVFPLSAKPQGPRIWTRITLWPSQQIIAPDSVVDVMVQPAVCEGKFYSSRNGESFSGDVGAMSLP